MNGTSILLVDDEKLIRNSFSWELRAAGYTVTAVANGAEAIDILEKQTFDVVITDLMMPVVDGFGVLKAVKARTPQTSAIILTGYGDMRSAIDALRLGADDFTLKPCEIDEVVFRINRCLEKQNLLRTLAQKNRQLEQEVRLRRDIEAELRASDARFRLALDSASNGVWDHDLVAGTLYYGPNWQRSLGYGSQTDASSHFDFSSAAHPDDQAKVRAAYKAHILGVTDSYEVEFRIRHHGGDWKWMLSRGMAVTRDHQGRAQRIIGTLTDITRIKDFEEQLEKQVSARTGELANTNIALTVLLKKREEDKASLAEQTLSNATNLVEPFLDRLAESGLSEQQKALVEVIRTNIKDLTAPLSDKLSVKMSRLTPIELQIAKMVKQGKRSKEIADILHVSPGTINLHRKNIRRKLEIAHRKTNLQSTLSNDT